MSDTKLVFLMTLYDLIRGQNSGKMLIVDPWRTYMNLYGLCVLLLLCSTSDTDFQQFTER